jgi:hypothetical protein
MGFKKRREKTAIDSDDETEFVDEKGNILTRDEAKGFGKGGKKGKGKGKDGKGKGKGKDGKGKGKGKKLLQSQNARENAEIKELTNRVLVEAPRRGEIFTDVLVDEEEKLMGKEKEGKDKKDKKAGKNGEDKGDGVEKTKEEKDQERKNKALVLTQKFFSDLPISKKTVQALKAGKFIYMTTIQRCAIPHALAGRDILAESKTGED